ncbi:RNA polymerase sigma factor [Parabacteroides sp. AF17-28]|uniref:RNA polymerase sigma factor n=1 Tax=Parabacteroides sp. AF17-28 TaxID=2292241 RepID=UPI000F004355|nr:RNA polymerase sigma factor [Parabacteroides sp. AF17-28]RHR53688.1 RNA polymerase sigma factor [Parabacteroides sp. AF17-28]
MKIDTLLVSKVILLGDRKAFNRLVEAYQSPVRRFFFNLTGGDEELSKDLAQDTFMKAWLNIGSFRSISTFSTWLYRIAYNTFYDYIRSRKLSAELDVETLGDILPAGSQDKDLGIDFTRALLLLRADERTVVLLFYMEDKSVETIAGIMSIPLGTVKSHLSRGKKKLTEYFKNTEYNI